MHYEPGNTKDNKTNDEQEQRRCQEYEEGNNHDQGAKTRRERWNRIPRQTTNAGRERERDERHERNIRDKYEICECDDLMKDKYEKDKYERLMKI